MDINRSYISFRHYIQQCQVIIDVNIVSIRLEIVIKFELLLYSDITYLSRLGLIIIRVYEWNSESIVCLSTSSVCERITICVN